MFDRGRDKKYLEKCKQTENIIGRKPRRPEKDLKMALHKKLKVSMCHDMAKFQINEASKKHNFSRK